MISIITPTHNRAQLLERLYQSLLRQTVKSFEWIVVNDGSTDNTEQVVGEFHTEEFLISYRRKDNGGKHRALNVAIALARYEWCFIVDDDDYLVPEAVKTIEEWIGEIRDWKEYAGVSGCKGYSREKRIGGFPADRDYIDAKCNERSRFRLEGDKAEVYRTEILRRYPFKEFEGENFLAEGTVWGLIAKDGYKLRWHKEIIYIADYLEDGLTRNGEKLVLENWNGFVYSCKVLYDTSIYLKDRYCAVKRYSYFWLLKGNRNIRKMYSDTRFSFVMCVVAYVGQFIRIGLKKNKLIFRLWKKIRGSKSR